MYSPTTKGRGVSEGNYKQMSPTAALENSSVNRGRNQSSFLGRIVKKTKWFLASMSKKADPAKYKARKPQIAHKL